ncbi:hypothetical protein DSO57_1037775 [Entomophthora muscae]|uniref:Uncharacterized protein n=2 Tax=Entomophthora muscae TaxID=34485 RepID=A0ACC2SBX0_9FUNG|nr:hypothetical protein DSO57_1037774 [Entomophthora muscae]KAJ9059799.1 hypothetical protein DSO57_1037775 [Entomophthora muscae]
MVSNKATRASLLTGPGGLTAPNSSRAINSNATNEQVAPIFSSELMTPVLNLHSPSSPDPSANTQPNPNENVSTPTDVMKHHLQEVDPESTPNQIKPVEEES